MSKQFQLTQSDFIEISPFLWEVPQSFRSDMRRPARVYASQGMLSDLLRDRSLVQLVNVATLPGIQGYSLAMPDAHEGYGFPIGGVAAFDLEEGVISPGGIGYDINCGVRLLFSQVHYDEVKASIPDLGGALYRAVPSGLGTRGPLTLSHKALDKVLEGGAHETVKLGFGTQADLDHLESTGKLDQADSSLVSQHAKERGKKQLGTMGSGNHFVEVDVVEKIFDSEEADRLGLFEGQVTVLIHSGSRGLGHQVATDYIRLMNQVMPRYGISLPDRELACVPFRSPEGQDYFRAMACAANFAWANRQMIMHEVREAWERVLGGAGRPSYCVIRCLPQHCQN